MRNKCRFILITILIMVLAHSILSAQDSELNKTDNSGNRIGKWTFRLDEELKILEDSTGYVYYKTVDYVSGRPIGYVNYYYKSGRLYFQSPVKSLDPDVYADGEIRYFSENGDKIKALNFQNGMLNGQATFFYPDGKTKLQGNYTDNIRTGIWKQWDENGSYGIGIFINDIADGKWTYYYADGTLKAEGKFSNGSKSGVWTEYGELGHISEGIYQNGYREGTWVCTYKNKRPCYIGSYKQGKKEGFWKEWEVLGKLSQGDYLNDIKEGIWEQFDPQGNKYIEGNYTNGKEDGQWSRFDKLGNIIETINYLDGKQIN